MRLPPIVLALALAGEPAWAQGRSPADELTAGMRQVDEGDLEAAAVTLQSAIRGLAADKGHEGDLVTARLYLAMTQLGLGRVEDAKAQVAEAARGPRLTLDPKRYPPTILQLYEQALAAEAKKAPKATPVPVLHAVVPSSSPVGQRRRPRRGDQARRRSDRDDRGTLTRRKARAESRQPALRPAYFISRAISSNTVSISSTSFSVCRADTVHCSS